MLDSVGYLRCYCIWIGGFAFSISESSTIAVIPSHKNQGSVQSDGTILVSSKYTIHSGQKGIEVTLPKFSQKPYFVLHFDIQ